MLRNIEIYIILFFIYSILGWAMEVGRILISNRRFVNRGFLIGPYCPIYGYGVLLITFLLRKYQNDLVATYIFSILICGILEYFTSYFMEKIFRARWWDYSNRKFNINGRICLNNLILFGILACIILYITNPIILEVLSHIPNIILHIVSISLFIIYIADNIVSSKIILNLKEIAVNVKDNTEEISQQVKKIISKKSILHRRLVSAFPNIKTKVNLKDWITKQEEKINELKNKINK